MRALLLIAALALLASQASAQVALRGSCNANQAFGTTANCTITGVVAGDLITVAIGERDGNTPSSVSSDLDGALALRVQRGNGVGEHALIYSLVSSTTGSHVITVAFAGNSVYQFYADAWNLDGGTGALDTTANAGNASGTSHSNGAPTTTAASIIVTSTRFAFDHSGVTPASGFTASGALARTARQYKISSSAESPSTTLTSSGTGTSNGVTANFLAGGGGGGGSVVPIILQQH